MSTLWTTDADELPPETSADAKKPEVFEAVPVAAGRGGMGSAVQSFAESQSLALGAVIRVNKTGASDVILESFSTYVKCYSGEAYSRHGVSLLCGPLVFKHDHKQFVKDAAVAQGVLRGLREKGVVVIENLVSPQDAARASREADVLAADEEKMFTAGTGAGAAHKRDGSLRGDSMCWLPKDGSLPPAMQYIQNKMNRLRRGIAYASGKALNRSSTQLARYPGTGIGYVRHRDSKLNAEPKDKRRITCVYYFNEDWCEAHGGQIVLYPDSGKSQLAEFKADSAEDNKKKEEEKLATRLEVAPRSGTLVIFPSHRIHQVLPEHAPRVAMTTWFIGPESLDMAHPDSEHDIDSYYTGNEDIYPSR
eukprot:Rhum_TRINITY_DN5978_c0_g1::Rhum_TRINITY_DN5978_c0_g1_i1::g.18850::m.18850/K09592/EGLN, HPH; hypoxia-inducible factor prolyl hydroxylase